MSTTPSKKTRANARTVHRGAAGTALAGTVVLALWAFTLSFASLTDLAERAGISSSLAWIWPLIIDGLVVVATVAIVALAGHGRRALIYPWALLFGGAAVSTAANALHAVLAADRTIPVVVSALVASVPPIVLLAVTHLAVVLVARAAPRKNARASSPAAPSSRAARPAKTAARTARAPRAAKTSATAAPATAVQEVAVPPAPVVDDSAPADETVSVFDADAPVMSAEAGIAPEEVSSDQAPVEDEDEAVPEQDAAADAQLQGARALETVGAQA